MEVKIIVSDAETATAAPGATALVGGMPVSMQGFAPQSSAQPDAAFNIAPGAATPPAELQRAAAALGALNGGPAPPFGEVLQSGAPPAFITDRNAATSPGNLMQGSSGAPDMAAGAAPGSGSQMETFTAPVPGGDE